MMKRTISIGFSTLMILSVFVVMDIMPIPNVSANDPVWVVDHWETNGDWIIDGTTTMFTFTTTTIIVNGNLTIMPGRTLTLQNVNLMMNSSYDGQYNITVKSGGNFIIEDLDDDHTTPGDASVITSDPTNGTYRYGFVVEGPSGYIELKNSELHECGWDNIDPDWEDAGLNIQGPNAIVTGNDISNNFRGLIIHNTSAVGAKIENNTIYDNSATGLWISAGSIDNHIATNEIYNNQYGIRINASDDPQPTSIINNMIYANSLVGILLDDCSNILITGNDIYDTNLAVDFRESGIYVEGSSYIQIIDNDIYENRDVGIFIANSFFIDIEENNILNHTGSAFYPGTGTYILSSDSVSVHNNYFDGNGGTALVDANAAIYGYSGSDISVTNNIVVNSNLFALRLENMLTAVADNNRFENNLGIGAIMIFTDILLGGRANNNTIINAGWTGILVGGCMNFDITNNSVENIVVENALGIYAVDSFPYGLKVYIYNNHVSNIGTGDQGTGIRISSIDPGHIVDSNIIDSATSYGMVIDTPYTTVKNNIITNVGTPQAANNFEDLGGLVLAGRENKVINNTIENCQTLGGAYEVAGIQFGFWDTTSFATDTVIKENYINGNEINIRSDDSNGDVSNIIIENTTLIKDSDTSWDIQLIDHASITLLNTTFDNSSISVDSTCSLTVKWYLHILVRDGGAGQDDAEVYIQNSFGNDEPATQPLITKTMDGEPGWVKWIPLTEFTLKGATQTFFTSHWVNVTYSTKEGLARPKMWMSHVIVIDLNEIPVIVNLKPGATSVFRDDTIYLFVNASDADPDHDEIDLEAFFEYREPSDYGWNTTYLGSVAWDGASGGFYKVPFTPPIDAPIGYYDLRVRVKDPYGSFSDWETLINATGIQVKNNKPYGEVMYNVSFGTAGPGAIYRGEHVWIHGDGHDVEDGDDENFTSAHFEYKAPGESWNASTNFWKPYSVSQGSGDWYMNFEPDLPIDISPLGIYQFRVKFLDTDGEWSQWYTSEQIDVLNNPPEYNAFGKESGTVYRGNSVKIYADVWDKEENEEDLEVHYYYKNVLDTVWDDTWLSQNGVWDTMDQNFFAYFTPPYSAEPGIYEFRVEITDHSSPGVDADTVIVDPAGTAVNVLNNIPTIIDVRMSSDTVRAEVENIYVHVNASDLEDSEDLLQVEGIKWRKNNTLSWLSDQGKLAITNDAGYITIGGGYLRAMISPSEDADRVTYDLQLWIKDDDGSSSNVIEIYNAFTVTNYLPSLHDLTIQKPEVKRGETMYITLNASDLGDHESDLTVEVEYKLTSQTTWTMISVTSDDYDDVNDYWKIPFSPGLDWEDIRLGNYQFRGKVKNSADGYSNTIAPSQTVSVLNNPPEAKSLGAEAGTMQRAGSIIIYAVGEDLEKGQSDLTPLFKYSTDGGSTWEDTYLDDEDYNGADSRWEITFSPPNDADLGDYDFKVSFHDGEDESQEITQKDLVKVTNAIPEVTSLTISDDTMFRMDSVTLTAVVSDVDEDLEDLQPNFQYQEPDSSTWVSHTQSNYFGTPSVSGGKWVITFTPPSDAEIGEYSFSVEFTDTEDVKSNLMELTVALTIENSPPEVSIDSPSPGSKDPGKFTFEATAYDLEDSDLTWEWDFGDGDTSNEESPEHEYKEPDDYIIKVKVTDSDGSSVEDEITLTIKKKTTQEMDMMMILLLLIPLIVAILIIVLLLTRGKKKPEDVPPPEMGAPSQPAPMPPAPGAPILKQEALPQAAPAPVPQAAPAAAPAAATAAPSGQMIKCPKCSTPFPVTSTERPITIECPNCGAKGTLN
jgi:parallel beta-helix repeat protein